MSASNSLDYRDGHEVFSAVTGGRPLSFSRRISGGSRSSELVEENAEGAGIPRGYVVEKTRPGALEQKKRPHDTPTAFSVVCNASSNMLSLITHMKSGSQIPRRQRPLRATSAEVHGKNGY